VERALGSADTQLLTLEQMHTAAEYMERFGLGYRLDSTKYYFPLGFAVKGRTTLVEVPERLAAAFPGGKRTGQTNAGTLTLCYAFESEELAAKLRQLFDQLVEEAAADVTSDTLTWLKELIEQPPHVLRESIAM
jgi:hypothetical protein